MKLSTLLLSFAFAVVSVFAQNRKEIFVRLMEPPIYPSVANVARLEGTVRVEVGTNSDGKVISTRASGPNEILERAAMENIRTWTFSESASGSKFVVVYVYKLEGNETYHPRPTRLILELPSRVEVIAQRVKPNP